MASPPPAPPPLGKSDAHAVPTWRAAYSDRTAAMMAHFSELAYVPFVDGTPKPPAGQPREEKPGGRSQLAALIAEGGFQVMAVFNKDNVQAFLAVNHDEFAVLAFRGTANLADWGINLNIPRIRVPALPSVGIHAGFWDTFHDMDEEILCAVNAHVPNDLGLYITGHSLGGALAQVASAVLERDNLAACYTYGSPRVATLNFDYAVKCPHYRLVDNWDLVPGVPTPAPWGYLHSGDARLLRGGAPEEIFRRDQDLLPRAWNYFWSFVLWPLRKSLTVIDDHMIWNYRSRLDFIAERQAGEAMKAAADDLAAKTAPPVAAAAVQAGPPSEPPATAPA